MQTHTRLHLILFTICPQKINKIFYNENSRDTNTTTNCNLISWNTKADEKYSFIVKIAFTQWNSQPFFQIYFHFKKLQSLLNIRIVDILFYFTLGSLYNYISSYLCASSNHLIINIE